ncbi:MAG: sulfate transporter CysZ, partial [Pseudomonadota bacterium]|nr:sulfate transporter CysZ [Pseudomonadota bacterium]
MAVTPVSGAGYLFMGVGLIRQPGLKRFVLIPLLINILVFSAAIYYGVLQFESFIVWMESKIPSWLQWLDWILWPMFVLALFIVVFYSFTL